MHITFLIQQNIDSNSGGVQIVTKRLIKTFFKYKHTINVVSLAEGHNENNERFNVTYLNTGNQKAEIKKSLKNYFKQNDTDVIINQIGFSLFISKILNKCLSPNTYLVTCLHINPFTFYENHEYKIKQYLQSKNLSFINSQFLRFCILKYHTIKHNYVFSFIVKNSDAYVMLSNRFKKELYHIAPKLKRYDEKIYGINNPFPIPDLKSENILKVNAIVYVGRLNIHQKRIDLLLDIWKALHLELPNWEFWVVGEGPEKQTMIDFCDLHHLHRVKFFGETDPNPYYKKAKMLNMTSAFEGFGNVLVEAQSFGCVPVLFNSYSAAQDIVLNQETGVLIKPFDIDNYVNQTIEIVNNNGKLKNLSLNAIEHSKNFSFEKVHEKWNIILESFNVS